MTDCPRVLEAARMVVRAHTSTLANGDLVINHPNQPIARRGLRAWAQVAMRSSIALMLGSLVMSLWGCSEELPSLESIVLARGSVGGSGPATLLLSRVALGGDEEVEGRSRRGGAGDLFWYK